jgi:hypothetical protein
MTFEPDFVALNQKLRASSSMRAAPRTAGEALTMYRVRTQRPVRRRIDRAFFVTWERSAS